MAQRPAENLEDRVTAVGATRTLDPSSALVRLLVPHGRLECAVQTVRGVRLFRRAGVERLAVERRANGRGRAGGAT